MRVYFKSLLLGVIVLTINCAHSVEINSQHEYKLNAIANLLTRSTISKQVLHSNNEAAIRYYQFSKSLYDDAVDAYHQGDIQKSDRLIKKSRHALMDSIEFANLQGAKRERGKQDYESLRKSADALIEALDRVSREKGKQQDYTVLFSSINDRLGKTDKLYFKERYATAITDLGEILLTVKTEISKLRSGDTLVKTLSFTSAKEEYIYEIDRNDTFFMLIDMFLDEKNRDTESMSNMKDTIHLAKKYRKQAESLAASDKHEEAIQMLEKSSVKIITQIRRSGVYIPD